MYLRHLRHLGIALLIQVLWTALSYTPLPANGRVVSLTRAALIRTAAQAGMSTEKDDTDPALVPAIDYTQLKSDDPRFLDMPWPTEAGPESAAFARHMQWKRRLSDGERLRWQRWAVYARLGQKHLFRYAAGDFVLQGMLGTMDAEGSSTALATVI